MKAVRTDIPDVLVFEGFEHLVAVCDQFRAEVQAQLSRGSPGRLGRQGVAGRGPGCKTTIQQGGPLESDPAQHPPDPGGPCRPAGIVEHDP